MTYVGIDLHSNRFTNNFLREDNSNSKKTFAINKGGLNLLSLMLSPEDHVAIEASTNTFAFYDLIKDKVKKVFVIDPLEFHIINKTHKKNDRIDAEKLSKMLKYHVECDETFLPLVYVPDENIRKLRCLFSTYRLYKKQIAMNKNRIHSILKQNLKPYTEKDIFSNKKREEILKLDIAEEYKIQINSLYETVDYLEENAEEIKNEILYAGRQHKDQIEILTSINGISAFIAIALIADYADIERFKNGRRFSSYLRAVPKLDASNNKIHNGNTHKKGRKLSISLLLQSITHFRKNNSNIENFYQTKIKGKSTGTVRMAVARKMFVSIFYMLRDKKYHNCRNKELHQLKMSKYNEFLEKYEDSKKIKKVA